MDIGELAGRTREFIRDAVQICGALGVIYDGPSEVHRWAIGRRAIAERKARA